MKYPKLIKKLFIAMILMGMMATFPHAKAQAIDSLGEFLQTMKENLPIQGTWQCNVVRALSGPFTVYQVYNADGITLNFSSSYLYADGPYGKGFLNRSGLPGDWEKIDTDLYRSRIKENLFRNYQDQPLAPGEGYKPEFNNRGRLGGTFYVEQILYHNPVTDTICSGKPAAAPDCPSEAVTKIKLVNLCQNGPNPDGSLPVCIPCTSADACYNSFNRNADIFCTRITDPSNFPDPLF